MKVVRSIIIFFALIFGFILQAEVFQTQLWNFDRSYYLSMEYNVSENELERFLSEVSNVAQTYGVSLFSTHIQMESNYKTSLTIFGNEPSVKDTLYRTMNIAEQKYTSLLNGTTEVKYHSLSELISLNGNSQNRLSFIGNQKDILKIYEEIVDKYDVGYPKYTEATEKDMILIVWLMIDFLAIVMSCIEVLRRKKEVVIRVSLGEDVRRIIVKSVLSDIAMYTLVYCFARLFIYQYISGEYEHNLALMVYSVGILLSVLPYLTFCRYDMRMAFANANESKGVLNVLYATKIIVTALTIVTLSTNLSSIHWNALSDDELIEPYKDCIYINLRNTGSGDYSNEEAFWNNVYANKYDRINPILCINILDDKTDYILLNNNAKDMLQGFSDMLPDTNDTVDFIIFIHKNLSLTGEKEMALLSMSSFIENTVTELNIQVIEYNERQVFSYIASSDVYGIKDSTNPVVIFQTNSNVKFDGASLQRYASNEIMFRVSQEEFENIVTDYTELVSGFETVTTNVNEYYTYQKNFIVKLVSFLSSLCVIVLLLDVAIVISISSMEYRIHSLEISLKKISGYSIFDRNKKLFVASLLSDSLIITALSILGLITDIYSAGLCGIIGVLLIAFETLILCGNITKVEKENIHKILKGGCL